MTTFIDCDVRPTLRNGGEPFQEIMRAVGSLHPGEGLRLLATFKPVPLFTVMEKKGYACAANPLEGGDWEVLFSPHAANEKEPGSAREANGSPEAEFWPDPVMEMDNRDLDPPEPMVRILAAVEEMRPGAVLSALLCREPVFLLPELKKRGHAWRGSFDPDGTTYRILVRAGTTKDG